MLPAARNPSLIGPERFRFLNHARDLSREIWDDTHVERLWRYNLHYFDDLNARDAHTRLAWHRALVSRWIRENPAGKGTGWEPYPTSLRIVNWIKWVLAGNELPLEGLASLAQQARWLEKRLERHLLGNHFFSNAKALVFAGLFFEGPEANRWLKTGLRILEREVSEQILVDGGHFERSTMYHALALEDMLDLCNITGIFPTAIPQRWQATVHAWRTQIAPMRNWLASMCHPDLDISFFNDASLNVAPSPAELERYARRLGFPDIADISVALTWLRASGYIRVQQRDAVVILDVAPIGPDYLPGHAHADTLSFEMSVFGQRVFVNSGTSGYDSDADRLRERGTSAHNTVTVDGQDSSEVWESFRVARRARPKNLHVDLRTGVDVACSHDGYHRLPGRPQHTRRWHVRDGSMTIEDRVSGSFEYAEARFHLHPAIQIAEAERKTNESAILVLAHGRQVHLTVEGGSLRAEVSLWSPEFGRTEASRCLVATLGGPMMRTRIDWGGTA